MLTGRRPFVGEQDAAVLYAITHREPEPMVSHRTDVPPDLEDVVRRALRKRPEERYPDVRQFREHLSSVTTATIRRLPRVLQQRNRWLLWVSSLLIATALVILFARYVWTFATPSNPEHQALAVVGFRSLGAGSDDPSLADITELVNVGLIESSPVRLISTEYLQDLRRRLFGASTGQIADDQALEVARRSGATLLLAGSIGKAAGERMLAWRLVDVRNGTNVAANTVRGASLTQIADQVVTGHGAVSTQEGPRDRDAPSTPRRGNDHGLAGCISTLHGGIAGHP